MKTTSEVFKEVLIELGFAGHKPSQMSNSDYWLCTTTAMERYAELVKKCNIADVSQQRELLIDFCSKAEDKAGEYKFLIPNPDFVDEYLKGNSSLGVVSQQRELLINLVKYIENYHHSTNILDHGKFIDEYISKIN